MRIIQALFVLGLAVYSGNIVRAYAETSVREAAHDVKKEARKNYRAANDKACEVVNGKRHCAGKKFKHKVQNATDEVKDKAE